MLGSKDFRGILGLKVFKVIQDSKGFREIKVA